MRFLFEALGKNPFLAFFSLVYGLIFHLQGQKHNIFKYLFLPHSFPLSLPLCLCPCPTPLSSLCFPKALCDYSGPTGIIQDNPIPLLSLFNIITYAESLLPCEVTCSWFWGSECGHLWGRCLHFALTYLKKQPLYHISQFFLNQKFGLDCI